jgi:probable O-glycosylation ligase (exosortase A-associated)
LIGLSVLAILFTFSRGGLLTLGVVGALLALHLRRPGLLVAVLLAAGAFFFLTPPQFQESYMERAGSIASFEQDPSAMGRLEAWELSWKVFLDHPWVGVGPDNFPLAARAYADATYTRVAHSALFQLLAEGGLPAVLLFALLLGTAIWRLQAVRAASDDAWARTWARMLQISIIGYVVGSVFLNMAYFDLIYHLVALSVSLEVVAEQGVEEAHQPDELVALPWWKQAPAARLKLL